MRDPILRAAPLIALALVIACAHAEADEESLKDSFAEQIAGSESVTDFARDGNELTFSGTDGTGGAAVWKVRIESSLVEPNAYDEEMPFQGRIASEWIADGEVVEYLGNMTALPQEFLDRGIGQECWAFWIEADRRWDW